MAVVGAMLAVVAVLLFTSFDFSKAAPSIFVDADNVISAYEDVRDDSTETKWAAITYVGKQLGDTQTGVNYDDMLMLLTDDSRWYCYVRFDLDVGTRYAFITWLGPAVPPLKKAIVSTDKAFVKDVFKKFHKGGEDVSIGHAFRVNVPSNVFDIIRLLQSTF